MTKTGYNTAYGYRGGINIGIREFATEEEYYEYLREKEAEKANSKD